MKPAAMLGVMLLAIGLFGLMYGGMNYLSHYAVGDVSRLPSGNEQSAWPVLPFLALLTAAGGMALLRESSSRRRRSLL